MAVITTQNTLSGPMPRVLSFRTSSTKLWTPTSAADGDQMDRQGRRSTDGSSNIRSLPTTSAVGSSNIRSLLTTVVAMSRRTAAVLWIIASLGYAVLRIALADRYLTKYGLNTLWFALVELLSTLAFGVASARLVGAALDKRFRAAVGWIALTLAGFLSADIYTILATRHLPNHMNYVVFGVIALGIVTTVIGLCSQLRQAEKAAGIGHEALLASGHAEGRPSISLSSQA